ncbi:MAG: YceI family protein [Flavobacteriales bacterium]|nr:YceI family protein [Flavobacteriales bacterium]
MKKVVLFGAVALLFASCGGNVEGDRAEANDAQDVQEVSEAVVYKANTKQSTIAWEGADVAGKVHDGAISLNEGMLKVKDGALVGGQFVIDMSSLVNHDVENEEYNAKLVGHLKSPDFFSVDSFPTASFEITSVEDYTGTEGFTHTITGNLTMKDITKSISFPANVSMDNGTISATTGSFVIDRSDWNVRFRSVTFFDAAELKDKAIKNDIGLKIKLAAQEANNTTASL